MPYYYNNSGEIIGIYIATIIVSLIVSVMFGCITKGINENKGYDGGFAWGFWLGWIGIIVVACRQPVDRTPRESIIVPANTVRSLPHNAITQQDPAAGSWKCSCGRYNARYISSCVCGISKQEAAAKAVAEAAAKVPSKSYNDEDKTISLLKEYKALLDSGVITQEEFDAKKKTILS